MNATYQTSLLPGWVLMNETHRPECEEYHQSWSCMFRRERDGFIAHGHSNESSQQALANGIVAAKKRDEFDALLPLDRVKFMLAGCARGDYLNPHQMTDALRAFVEHLEKKP